LRKFGLATARKVRRKDSVLTQCESTSLRTAVFQDFTSGICGNTVDGEWVCVCICLWLTTLAMTSAWIGKQQDCFSWQQDYGRTPAAHLIRASMGSS